MTFSDMRSRALVGGREKASRHFILGSCPPHLSRFESCCSREGMYSAGAYQPVPSFTAQFPQTAPPLQCHFCRRYFPREHFLGHLVTHLQCPFHCLTHMSQFLYWEKVCEHQLVHKWMNRDGTGKCQIVTQRDFVIDLFQAAVKKSESLQQPIVTQRDFVIDLFQAAVKKSESLQQPPSSSGQTPFLHNSVFQNGDNGQATASNLGEEYAETSPWNVTSNHSGNLSTTQIKVEVEGSERDPLEEEDRTPPGRSGRQRRRSLSALINGSVQ